MAIEVVCDCGKRLKAPDWMAGRRTQCPACWVAVQIPKRRWINVGRLAGTFTRHRSSARRSDSKHEVPNDRSQTAPSAPSRSSSASSALPADRYVAQLVKGQPSGAASSTFVPSRGVGDGDDYRPDSVVLRTQPRWVKLLPDRGEQQWYHSLLFPFGKLPVFFRLGFLLAILTTNSLILWLSLERESPSKGPIVVCLAACVCGLFFVLGHTFHYFNAILEMAAHGKTRHEPGIGCSALGALVSCGHWLGCFVMGPALLFGAALGYWLYCGDLSVIDWMILIELCYAGVGWWLIALLLTNLDDTLRVASPGQIVRTVLIMRWETAGLTALAAVVVLGHFFFAAYAISQLYVTPLSSFPLLWACWSSGLYLTAFMFRRLGLTYYRAQVAVAEKRQASRPLAALRYTGGIGSAGTG
jgi:hypothetical protein